MGKIDLNIIVGINPNYVMRRDGGVGTLCNGTREYDSVIHHGNFLSHIHLFTAIFFSCFDGERTLSESVRMASELLSISFDRCLELALIYINNKEVISNKINNNWQAVPEFMLVPVIDGLKYNSYNYEAFISDSYDFNPPNRLPIPLSLNLILTTKCVVDCKYCYAKRTIPNHPDFTVERIINIITEAKELGVVKVDINGGDVLLYPYWVEVVRHMINLGYTPLISTKKALTDNDIERLISLNVKRIQISLDSIIPDICSSLLNVHGYQYIERMKKSLSLLDKTDITVQINSVITCSNSDVEGLDMLIDFLSKYKCIKEVSFTPAGYSIYKHPYSDFAPKRSQIEILCKHLKDSVINRFPKIKFSISEGEFSPISRTKEYFFNRAFCTANTRNAVILPDGRVTICEELYDHPSFIIGDLKKESLLGVWNSSRALSLFNYKQTDIPEKSFCRRCPTFEKCRTEKGVCWKTIVMAYGEDNCFLPDPLCPYAPKPMNKYWIE